MKKEKPKLFEASDRNSQTTISSIGEILEIDASEIKTMISKKKAFVIIGVIMLLLSILTGCTDPGGGGHYMAFSIIDASWFQRFL